jgi:hypothetical protein
VMRSGPVPMPFSPSCPITTSPRSPGCTRISARSPRSQPADHSPRRPLAHRVRSRRRDHRAAGGDAAMHRLIGHDRRRHPPAALADHGRLGVSAAIGR